MSVNCKDTLFLRENRLARVSGKRKPRRSQDEVAEPTAKTTASRQRYENAFVALAHNTCTHTTHSRAHSHTGKRRWSRRSRSRRGLQGTPLQHRHHLRQVEHEGQEASAGRRSRRWRSGCGDDDDVHDHGNNKWRW